MAKAKAKSKTTRTTAAEKLLRIHTVLGLLTNHKTHAEVLDFSCTTWKVSVTTSNNYIRAATKLLGESIAVDIDLERGRHWRQVNFIYAQCVSGVPRVIGKGSNAKVVNVPDYRTALACKAELRQTFGFAVPVPAKLDVTHHTSTEDSPEASMTETELRKMAEADGSNGKTDSTGLAH